MVCMRYHAPRMSLTHAVALHVACRASPCPAMPCRAVHAISTRVVCDTAHTRARRPSLPGRYRESAEACRAAGKPTVHVTMERFTSDSQPVRPPSDHSRQQLQRRQQQRQQQQAGKQQQGGEQQQQQPQQQQQQQQPPPPPPTQCEAFCAAHEKPWSVKCAWGDRECSACADCAFFDLPVGVPLSSPTGKSSLSSPTNATTTATAEAEAAAPTPEAACETFCVAHTKPWAIKCGWPERECSACAECAS